MKIKELLKKQNKDFKDNFFVEVGFGADNTPYQIAHKNKNGRCDFIEKNDIEQFIFRANVEIIRAVCDELIPEEKKELNPIQDFNLPHENNNQWNACRQEIINKINKLKKG